MLSAGEWARNQQNLIKFVLTDSAGTELIGLGGVFDVFVSKTTGGMVAGAGTKGENGLGHYYYLSTAGEADTGGPVSIVVQGLGVLQQNLEYVVVDRAILAVDRTYTVKKADDTLVPDARVEIHVNSAGTQLAWVGYSDAFGVARDSSGNKPRLQPGVWYYYRYKVGYSFTNPDTETYV